MNRLLLSAVQFYHHNNFLMVQLSRRSMLARKATTVVLSHTLKLYIPLVMFERQT